MSNLSKKRRFSNHRQWREFVAAVHETLSFACPLSTATTGEALCWQPSANWLRGLHHVGVANRQPTAMRVDVAVSLA